MKKDINTNIVIKCEWDREKSEFTQKNNDWVIIEENKKSKEEYLSLFNLIKNLMDK